MRFYVPPMPKSIHAPTPAALPAKRGSYVLSFLILSVLAVGFAGAGFVLGIESRLVLDRSEGGTFRVTGTGHFAGWQFSTKMIEGVKGVVVDDAVRDGRRDPEKVNRKRRKMLHLELVGADGREIGWERESDQGLIEEFMRGREPGLTLVDKPPLWRRGLAWCLIVFGGLVFVGAIQSSFFPKKKLPGGLP